MQQNVWIGFRISQVQPLQGIDDRVGDEIVAYPLVIRGDEVPWSVRCRAVPHGISIRIRIAVPQLAIVDVPHAELPVLLLASPRV